ncbi:MAG TPA: hypothetical protein VGM07_07420 [Stellaceae bacterium]|jgi:hypothetical protein
MAISKDLVEVILERTREWKLQWSELSRNGFTSEIAAHSITIDLIGPGQYTLTIADERGNVLERVEASARSVDALWEIYNLARRQALRVDDALLTLRRKLEEL